MAGTKGIRAGKAFVELYADNSRLVRGLRLASRQIKAFGANVRTMGLKMAGLGTMAIAPMALAAKAFSSMGDGVAKMSKRTGVGVEALSELRFVASQTGTEFATLENAFRKMQRSVYDAGRGLSTQTEALADLGLEFKHLDGLLPIDQFKLLADRIGQVEDPTKKAAIAMSLMGRTGTNLLPMFAQGAAGIEKLQQEARRLGLTMSAEDAKAAEDFTDAMDKLGKVLKMGVFRVGAAMAKRLTDMGEKITKVGTQIGEWIDTNRGLIVTVAKIAGGVTVAGIAIAGLGTIIGGVGTVLGVVATTLKAIPIALAAITSPLGLVVAGVASMGAALAVHTKKGKKAIEGLGEKFVSLKDGAKSAWADISDVMTTGNVEAAAQLVWLKLKIQWQKGSLALVPIVSSIEEVFLIAISSIQSAWEDAIYEMAKKFTWLQYFIKGSKNFLETAGKETSNRLAHLMALFYTGVKNGFDQEDLHYLSESLDDNERKILDAYQGQIDALDQAKKAASGAIDQYHERQSNEIDKNFDEKYQAIQSQKKKNVDQLEAALDTAAAEYDKLMDAMRNGEDTSESPFAQFRSENMPPVHLTRDQLREQWKADRHLARQQFLADRARQREEFIANRGKRLPVQDMIDNITDGLDSVMGKVAMSVKGTFSAEAIAGLGVGDNKMDKLVTNTERTADGVKTIAREARNGGMAFA